MSCQPCSDLEELSKLSSLLDFSRNPYITALSDSAWFNHLQTLLGTTVHSVFEMDEAVTYLLATIEGLEAACWGLEGYSKGRTFEPHKFSTNQHTEPPVIVAYAHLRILTEEGNDINFFEHHGETARASAMELCLQRIKAALKELGALSFALRILENSLVGQRHDEREKKNNQERWIEEQRQITKQRQETIARQRDAAVISDGISHPPSASDTNHDQQRQAPSESSSDSDKSGGIPLGLNLSDSSRNGGISLGLNLSDTVSTRQRRRDFSAFTASKIHTTESHYSDTNTVDDEDWKLYNDAADAFEKLGPTAVPSGRYNGCVAAGHASTSAVIGEDSGSVVGGEEERQEQSEGGYQWGECDEMERRESLGREIEVVADSLNESTTHRGIDLPHTRLSVFRCSELA